MLEQYLTIEHLSTIEIANIFNRISIDAATGCWAWTGPTAGQYVYPSTYYQGKRQYVHRIIYAWLIEPVPLDWTKLQVDHLCNFTLCCNPCHLQLKTAEANNRRSDSCTARNLRKTHCKRGHLLEGKNLINPEHPKGYRVCRICKNEAQSGAAAAAKKRAYRAANIERVREHDRDYHWRNKEKLNAKCLAYYYSKKGHPGKLSE